MENQACGRGGTGRRKGLKISCGFPQDVETASCFQNEVWKQDAKNPGGLAPNQLVLETHSSFGISVKKVKNSTGKRYAYIRGTSIALVRTFVGTDEEFDAAIAEAARKIGHSTKGNIADWRTDAARALHKITRSRAGSRGQEYTLSADLIAGLLAAADDRCVLTGIAFDYGPNRREWSKRPMSPSIDRINNGMGYTTGNVRLVCTCVNIAINEWGLENFDKVCRAYVDLRPFIAEQAERLAAATQPSASQ